MAIKLLILIKSGQYCFRFNKWGRERDFRRRFRRPERRGQRPRRVLPSGQQLLVGRRRKCWLIVERSTVPISSTRSDAANDADDGSTTRQLDGADLQRSRWRMLRYSLRARAQRPGKQHRENVFIKKNFHHFLREKNVSLEWYPQFEPLYLHFFVMVEI